MAHFLRKTGYRRFYEKHKVNTVHSTRGDEEAAEQVGQSDEATVPDQVDAAGPPGHADLVPSTQLTSIAGGCKTMPLAISGPDRISGPVVSPPHTHGTPGSLEHIGVGQFHHHDYLGQKGGGTLRFDSDERGHFVILEVISYNAVQGNEPPVEEPACHTDTTGIGLPETFTAGEDQHPSSSDHGDAVQSKPAAQHQAKTAKADDPATGSSMELSPTGPVPVAPAGTEAHPDSTSEAAGEAAASPTLSDGQDEPAPPIKANISLPAHIAGEAAPGGSDKDGPDHGGPGGRGGGQPGSSVPNGLTEKTDSKPSEQNLGDGDQPGSPITGDAARSAGSTRPAAKKTDGNDHTQDTAKATGPNSAPPALNADADQKGSQVHLSIEFEWPGEDQIALRHAAGQGVKGDICQHVTFRFEDFNPDQELGTIRMEFIDETGSSVWASSPLTTSIPPGLLHPDQFPFTVFSATAILDAATRLFVKPDDGGLIKPKISGLTVPEPLIVDLYEDGLRLINAKSRSTDILCVELGAAIVGVPVAVADDEPRDRTERPPVPPAISADISAAIRSGRPEFYESRPHLPRSEIAALARPGDPIMYPTPDMGEDTVRRVALSLRPQSFENYAKAGLPDWQIVTSVATAKIIRIIDEFEELAPLGRQDEAPGNNRGDGKNWPIIARWMAADGILTLRIKVLGRPDDSRDIRVADSIGLDIDLIEGLSAVEGDAEALVAELRRAYGITDLPFKPAREVEFKGHGIILKLSPLGIEIHRARGDHGSVSNQGPLPHLGILRNQWRHWEFGRTTTPSAPIGLTGAPPNGANPPSDTPQTM